MQIVIAGRQSVTRSAIRRLLQIKLGLDQISEAVTPADLMTQIESGDIALVVLDANLRDQCVAQLVTDLKQVPDPPIVFALDSSPDSRQVFLDAGADEFLYKGDPPKRLLIAVETVRQTKTTDGG